MGRHLCMELAWAESKLTETRGVDYAVNREVSNRETLN